MHLVIFSTTYQLQLNSIHLLILIFRQEITVTVVIVSRQLVLEVNKLFEAAKDAYMLVYGPAQ